MQKKRINSTFVVVVLLTMLSIISLTLAGIVGALYVKEKNQVVYLEEENRKLRDEISIPVFSDNNTNIEVNSSENVEIETVEDLSSQISQAETNVVLESESAEGETVNDDEMETEAIQNNDNSNSDSIISPKNTDVLDINGDYVTASGNVVLQEDMIEILAAKENEIEKGIKDKIRELVTAEDGSPLKMLRSIFPENLIYADNNEYVFHPVMENLKKHKLLSQNFIETENGEMQYIEDGVVKSHKGIDVSKYQGNINWNAVKADGIEYAFIRLGLRGYESGKIVMDEYYQQNMEGANAAGVPVGVYFFTQAVNVEEANEEAQYVIDALQGYEISCPVVYDVEMITTGNGRANNISQQERTEICIAFCEAIKQAGYTPMIYGNVKCFTKMLDISRLEAYEKWYAFYDDYMYFPYEVSCWQYTEKGRVNGINGDVDLNISYKLW